jgi:hypothetical protein
LQIVAFRVKPVGLFGRKRQGHGEELDTDLEARSITLRLPFDRSSQGE